jgi:DNA invertase Pin-like site-specific DNA recombinase
MTKRPPRAVGYARVSTDDQAERGAGLKAQRDAITAAAKRLGLPLAAVHVDEGVSGAAPLDRRPALATAISSLGPGDVLLVAKRDRLARNLALACALDLEAQRRRGARIVAADGADFDADGDPFGVFYRQMRDAVAELERGLIAMRTKAALGAKRRRREVYGAVPLGYRRRGNVLVLVPREAATLRRVAALRASGASLRRIARTLTEEGYRTKNGGTWAPATVSYILKRIRRDADERAA